MKWKMLLFLPPSHILCRNHARWREAWQFTGKRRKISTFSNKLIVASSFCDIFSLSFSFECNSCGIDEELREKKSSLRRLLLMLSFIRLSYTSRLMDFWYDWKGSSRVRMLWQPCRRWDVWNVSEIFMWYKLKILFLHSLSFTCWRAHSVLW